MDSKFYILITYETYDLVPQRDDMKVIGYMWLCKTKTKPRDVLDKHKTQVIA